jgi:hypothetical protein
MNILFHTTTAISVAVLLTDTNRIKQATNSKIIYWTSFFAFTVSLISHGALDYIPHCYPINSKLDAIAGLTMILLTIWLANKKYRLIIGLAFAGCIFPDLVDQLPSILNKEFGFELPILAKIFPWHLKEYSGSIYSGNCNISNLNHVLLIFAVAIIFFCRWNDVTIIFKKQS